MLMIYEVASALVFFVALGWAIRSGNAFKLGALLGGFLLFVFDWIWCGKEFFNATFNPALTMLPGLDVLGQQYPIAVAMNWAVGFGVLPLLLSNYHSALSARLGGWHFPVLMLIAAVLDMAMEIPLVSGLGVYSYHQAPEYLLWGVPWSNLWFGAGLLVLPYFAFSYARRWVDVENSLGFHPGRESTWRGLLSAMAALWAAFFALMIPQLFWYCATTPWVESGRLF